MAKSPSKPQRTGSLNPQVDAFVLRNEAWSKEIHALRQVLLKCGLSEELKWGKPCYQLEGSNIAIIQPFKEHCSLMFFKGVLLKDTLGLLRSPGENSQAARRLEFSKSEPVKKSLVADYIKQAISLELAGSKVDFKAKESLDLADELQAAFSKSARLKSAFEQLTPGRRRAYVLFFSSAKQSATRRARIEKCTPQILAGQGLNDR